MAKLIVWDLDDTLWNGTLAEGDSLEPIESRIEAIRTLNEQGVVHSICSKNDPNSAKEYLQSIGMWDQFVFPDISFEPKGFRVKRIVENMQLRFPDVVFVDDNKGNLREVEFECEGITTFDATENDIDAFLEDLIENTQGSSSRVGRYRILEEKHRDREKSAGSNEDFLRSTDIRVTFLRMADNLPHAQRIEELINRTNQLNFLKTRVKPGEISEMLVDPNSYESSVFVWDKYGNYGLVGFGSLTKEGLNHFTFSCRTMNMGIERALAWGLRSFRASRGMKFPVEASLPEWITVIDPDSDEARQRIEEGTKVTKIDADVRIMANCQSAALAHYINGTKPIDFDNWPRTFTLGGYAQTGEINGEWAKTLVYGAFVDYLSAYWPNEQLPEIEDYTAAVDKLISESAEKGSQLVVLLPVEDFEDSDPSTGMTKSQFTEKNAVWRERAAHYDHLQLLELSSLTSPFFDADPRHMTRDQLMELSARIKTRLDL